MLSSTNQYKQQTVLAPALTAIVGVALAAVILLVGTTAAGALKEKGGELIVTQVFQQESRQMTGEQNKLLRRKTMALLKQYAFAFVDAAIEFETIPRMDSKVFLIIATAMPEDVSAEKIVFEDQSILLHCTAEQENSGEVFYESLRTKAQFESVTYSTPVFALDGIWHFEVCCTPRLAEGQLAMALPEPARNA